MDEQLRLTFGLNHPGKGYEKGYIMLKNLEKYHVLLASKSPRRRELLAELKIPFHSVTVGGIDETYPDSLPKLAVPQYLAERKADAYMEILRDNELIITADTLVVMDNKIYGKPKDKEEAMEMLRELSGRTHKVVSGLCIMTAKRRTSFTTITEVTFCEIAEEEIEYYVDTYLPMDKAGAYGIQEWIGCIAVEQINGSFYNVMGLPIHRLYHELRTF